MGDRSGTTDEKEQALTMERSKATASATATTTLQEQQQQVQTGPIQFRRKAPNFKFNSPLLHSTRIASASECVLVSPSHSLLVYMFCALVSVVLRVRVS